MDSYGSCIGSNTLKLTPVAPNCTASTYHWENSVSKKNVKNHNACSHYHWNVSHGRKTLEITPFTPNCTRSAYQPFAPNCTGSLYHWNVSFKGNKTSQVTPITPNGTGSLSPKPQILHLSPLVAQGRPGAAKFH